MLSSVFIQNKISGVAPVIIVLFAVVLMESCRKTDTPASYSVEEVLAPIATQLIVPAHEDLITEIDLLSQKGLEFETATDLASLSDLQNQLISTHSAWKRCEPYKFGEAKETFIHNRIGKWPTNPFLLEQAIAGSDSIHPGFIESRGSTSRGLSAIEYLLHQKEADSTLYDFTIGPQAERRMMYLLGLIENLEEKASALLNFWASDDYGNRWANSTLSGIDHPMGLLVNAMAGLIEEVSKSKVGTPLGKFDFEVPQPETVETPYADYSLELVKANISSLHDCYLGPNGAGGIDDALDMLEAKYDGNPLSGIVENAFVRAENSLNAITPPLKEAVISESEVVNEAYDACRDLLILFKADLASALSVTITVSDNDGD